MDRADARDLGAMIRGLTEAEAALAREVFGAALDVDPVRLWAAPWPFRRAFVAGRWFGRDWIVWPAPLPVEIAEAPLRLQALLVHELVHVWQGQQGISLLIAKLKAGDDAAAYRYPVDDLCDWRGLNIEQQAMVVEHRFRLSRGERTPADQVFYNRVCPLGRK
jgi:hypothetical protein